MAKASQLCLPFAANGQAGKVARAGLWTKDHSWTCWSANLYALLTGERRSNATSMMDRGSMATLAKARAFVAADDTFKTAAYPDHIAKHRYPRHAAAGRLASSQCPARQYHRANLVTHFLANASDRALARSNFISSNTIGKETP
jgi:hypothetical protein